MSVSESGNTNYEIDYTKAASSERPRTPRVDGVPGYGMYFGIPTVCIPLLEDPWVRRQKATHGAMFAFAAD